MLVYYCVNIFFTYLYSTDNGITFRKAYKGDFISEEVWRTAFIYLRFAGITIC